MYCTVGGKLAINLLQLQAQCPTVGARKVKEGIVCAERGYNYCTMYNVECPTFILDSSASSEYLLWIQYLRKVFGIYMYTYMYTNDLDRVGDFLCKHYANIGK